MARKRPIRLQCPTCKKPVKGSDPEFPFCSERCRLIDLGAWADGSHAIPGEPADMPSVFEQDDEGSRLN